MKKLQLMLILISIIFIIANFTNLLPYRIAQVTLYVILGISAFLSTVREYNQYHDNWAKIGFVLAVFCFVKAAISFFRLA